MSWRLASDVPLTVVEAWHPHHRFRSARRRLSLRVTPRASATLELPARCDGRPGEVIENLFLVVRIASARRAYQVFARLAVRIDADGTPRPRVAAIDVHPASG